MATTGERALDPERLLAAVGQAVIVTDPDGCVLSWNAGAERLYGWSAAEVVGRPIAELTVAEVSLEDAEHIMGAVRAGQTWTGSFTVRRKDGSSFQALVTNTGVHDEDGQTVAIVGVSIGLGDAVRPLLEHSIDAAVVISSDGRVRYASPAITNVFGYLPGELEGCVLRGMVHTDDWGVLAGALDHAGDEKVPIEVRVRDSEGAWRWTEAVLTDLTGDPAVRGVVVNLRDVTERRATHERLTRLALHDPLTGLPNRTLVADRIQHALTRRGQAGALLFVDLDDFKQVNDRFGHSAGDDLLRTVASRLLSTLRTEDTCGRLGGDEFIVLAEQVRSATEACDVAERIQAALRVPVRVGSTTVTQTASVGITLLAGRERAHELLREADTAMYAAKAAGVGRYALFAGGSADVRAPGGIVERLRQALHADELRVHFQPVVDLTSRELCGVESLLRWQHPERGLVLAEEFIDAAESSDLINDIGAFVLQQACQVVGRWPGRELSVSINVSARQLLDAALPDVVGRALADSGVAPEQLVLEITETALLQDVRTALDVLAACREKGVRVSIDDFGTGFAGFSYLRDLPVDEIKIDKSFVAGLGIEPSATAIVDSILHLAHGLGLGTTGEGVETPFQARRLQELGCDLGQGYYWSPAVVGRSCPPVVHDPERRLPRSAAKSYRDEVDIGESYAPACAPLGGRPDLRTLADPARVAAVERLISAGASNRGVQRLTVLSARLLNTCCAQVSLLAAREQFVAAAVGVPWNLDVPRTPAEDSMCSVTVALARPFAVEDAAGHPWVYDLPPVTSGQVSSYLGVVLTDAAGHILGSLCVYGGEPRQWTEADVDILTAVAEAVADELEDEADRWEASGQGSFGRSSS